VVVRIWVGVRFLVIIGAFLSYSLKSKGLIFNGGEGVAKAYLDRSDVGREAQCGSQDARRGASHGTQDAGRVTERKAWRGSWVVRRGAGRREREGESVPRRRSRFLEGW
jgi:hypothetical protein